MIYATDTHPLVWLLEGNPRLSSAARSAFGEADAQMIIPSIVLVEIKFLFARRRITIDVPMTLAHIAATPNCLIYPLDELIVERLPTSLNIHDAIIVATALVHQDVLGETIALITKDAEIVASGLVPVLW
jgi:PIN domain nuclease of toxin-antitoxin system